MLCVRNILTSLYPPVRQAACKPLCVRSCAEKMAVAPLIVQRTMFPQDFVFGTATAAYQVLHVTQPKSADHGGICVLILRSPNAMWNAEV